jgi:hemolysin III
MLFMGQPWYFPGFIEYKCTACHRDILTMTDHLQRVFSYISTGKVMYHGERFNSISHLVGAALALAGLVVLVVVASLQGDPWKIVSFSIYGASLFLLYTLSALYHSLRGRAKVFFRKLDHVAIYLLIAGSYTPLTLVTLRGIWGWTLFIIIWCLAIVGIIVDSLHREGSRSIQMVIYLLMGWLILVATYPLIETLPHGGLVLLVLGGVFYTSGIIFYVLDGRMKHAHGIWHLFVLAGSISHFLAMLLYVL